MTGVRCVKCQKLIKKPTIANWVFWPGVAVGYYCKLCISKWLK